MLRETHREAIVATLPREVPAAFWNELEEAIDAFLMFETRRIFRPPLERRDRWLQIAALAKNEEDDFLQNYAEVRALAYGMIGAGFDRRNDPYRSCFLIGTLLGLWLRYIDDDLRVSRNRDTGAPGGPLIRYIVACLTPVLGEISPETIKTIINREKRRIARHGGLAPRK
jgi:hypothetical protein